MAKKSGKSAAKRKSVKAAAKNTVSPKTIAKPKLLTDLPQPKRPTKRLPNVWQLTKTASLTLWRHKKLFIGIIVIYGLLNIVLAQGLSNSTDVSSLKQTLNQASKGNFSGLTSGLSIFVTLIGSSSGDASTSAGAYQLFLALIASLAIIWGLRQVLAGSQVRIRDAYYRGIYPLVPFVLVLLVICLQLIPLLIGATVYGLVINNGIAVLLIEKLIFALLFALLAAWSLYMVSSSLFALYVVTLPDMTPMRALRSAKELVHSRRWTALRKVLCLPLILLAAGAVIMLPIIIWLTPLSKTVFFLLTLFVLAAVHAYMYTLYRELLDE